MIELWSQDQYGTGTILGSFDTPEEALTAARKKAHQENRENPLTFDEQKRYADWLVVVMVSVRWTLAGADAGGGGTGLPVTTTELPLVPAALAAANIGNVGSIALTSGQVTSGTAVLVTTNFVVVTATTASGSLTLNPALSGVVEIMNRGTVLVQVFPGSTGQIESLGTNTASPVLSGANGKFLLGAAGPQYYIP